MITNQMSGVNDARHDIYTSLLENSDAMSTIVFRRLDLRQKAEQLYICYQLYNFCLKRFY